MKQITINDARKLAKQTGAQGIIILQFDKEDVFPCVSYGANKQKCTAMSRVMGQICEQISTGEIRVPYEFFE